MPRYSRLLAAAAAGVLTLAGLGLLAPAAEAASLPTVVGSAPSSTHGPGTITFSYTLTLPEALTATSFSTHQPALLPARLDAVTLDSASVPAADLSRPSSVDLVVDTHDLTAGTHTVTFTADLPASEPGSPSSTATLTGSAGGGPVSATSAPVVVQVNQPDLSIALTPDSGEDQVGFLGTGQNLDFAVDVANLGFGSPDSTLTLSLPPGMQLGPDGVARDADGSSLVCAPAAGTVSCDLGPLAGAPADPTIVIDLTTAGQEPIGSTVTLTATVSANTGTDTDPSNNSVSAELTYTGIARLHFGLQPSARSVAVGASTTVTLRVSNAGPQPAPATLGLAILIGDNFTISNFTGSPLPTTMSRAQLAQAQLLSATGPAAGSAPPVAPAAGGGSGVLWFIGNLPAGSSASATLTLTAVKPGPARLAMLALSGAGDPGCTAADCPPAELTLTAVRPSAPSSSPAAPAAGGGDALASTGASVRPAETGGLLLLLGAGLVVAGRRRRVLGGIRRR